MIKRAVEEWTIDKIYKERARISFPEYQREKTVWTNEKKSMLIDSILRDIDIPKLYFNRLKDKNIEVIDGQQRLWSIWEFLDNEYLYRTDGRGQRFSELTSSQKERVKKYNLQVTVFEEADDAYLREVFLRLQLGALLNTGEKLHASTGKMKQLVFDDLTSRQFIKHLGIPAKRYAKQTLCAQICINSFNREKLGTFSRTRYDDLLHFFSEYGDPQGKDLELFRKTSKKILKTLDLLWEIFGKESEKLRNRSYILSLYLFIEEMVDKSGDLSEREQKTFSEFALKLWRRLKEETKMGMDRKNRELYSFDALLSSAPGEEYQIARRHEKLGEYYSHFKETKKIKGDR